MSLKLGIWSGFLVTDLSVFPFCVVVAMVLKCSFSYCEYHDSVSGVTGYRLIGLYMHVDNIYSFTTMNKQAKISREFFVKVVMFGKPLGRADPYTCLVSSSRHCLANSVFGCC